LGISGITERLKN